MPVIYNVNIEPTGKENQYRITWHNIEANTEDFFEQSAAVIMPDKIGWLWQQPQHQLDIGRKLFRFLDGDSRYLQRALDDASQKGESLQVNLRTCQQTADWPFELLTKDNTFLLPQRLHLVRYVSDWGIEKKIHPQERPLKLLFMTSTARDVMPELDFEQEEEAIFQITENLIIDMEIEDSGSLEGLRSHLEQEQYDVVHLSGHAGIDKSGHPYFVMEDETGYQHNVYPDELWNKALIENPPRLLFLSGCRTGETPDNSAAFSFAHLLVEKYHVPAVLGWGRSVVEKQANHATRMLLRELSRGKSILESIQRARYELLKGFPMAPNPAWPLLRLFSNGTPLDAIVKKGQRWQPKPQQLKHVYLEQSRVQVLAQGFVGRRRQLQTSLGALKQDGDKVGVLLLGTGGLGKSCLAGKICERFYDHTLIIVHGSFNTITLEAALTDAFIASQDEKGQQILSQKIDMTKKLGDLCATSFKEKNYLLLLDGFDQNLKGVEKGKPGPLLPEAEDLLKVLLHYLSFSGKKTQLIITSRYDFSLVKQGRNLVEERLSKVWLTSFQESEQRKKARELKNILNYPEESVVPQLLSAGYGNPRLMEWLDILVGRMASVESPQLMEAIKDKQEDFIRDHVLRELLQRASDELTRFLRWFSIYRRPVLGEGVELLTEKAGLGDWQELLQEGMGLSLIEHDQAHQSYQVTPLLREELLKAHKEHQASHEAAFEYYQKVYERQEPPDPILVEEWIFHSMGSGQEDVVSRRGVILVNQLRERLALKESRRVGEWILAEKNHDLNTGDDAILLNSLAATLRYMGDNQQAMRYIQQALEIDRAVYGKRHPKVASDLNNLGEVLRDLGKPNKAIDYYQQALEIYREVCGEEDHKLADTLNNLGMAMDSLGEYKKSLNYFQQALDIDSKVYGEEHQNVASRLNNLGSAWLDLGEYDKAIDYFQQALYIDRKVFGDKHPNIASRLNNLGSAWLDLGEYKKAIDYFQQALYIDREVFGDKHPNVASRLNNLGSAWLDLGEYKKAIDYFQQALNIDHGVYGDEHPVVAQELNNLGLAWDALGDYHKAIDYFQQALSIDRTAFGDEHPNVAQEINNLGKSWRALGETKKAIEYYEHALGIDYKIFGENHPKIATRFRNLGEAYLSLGKTQKAIDYFEQALSIDKAVFGNDHPNVASTMNYLGAALADSGENERALNYCQKSLSIAESVLGKKHPEVAKILNNLGSIYTKLGDEEQAANHLLEAHEIAFNYVGLEHPLSKNIALNLQNNISKLIRIEIEGVSGFLIDEKKEINLNIFNRSRILLNQIKIELDSSPEYDVCGKKFKCQIEKLGGLESKTLNIPLCVRETGKITLSLKLFDDYYRPAIVVYSYKGNPYTYGPAIMNNDNFFGREKEFTEITDEMFMDSGPHRLVIGVQRVGKTSFLNYLKNSLPDPVIPVYITLEDIPCPQEKDNDEIVAYKVLLDILMDELKKQKILDEKKVFPKELKYGYHFRQILSEIIEKIKINKKGFRLCLLLDEGDYILKIREAFQKTLRSTLHNLREDFRLILACSNDFREHVQESKSSPLRNIFRYTRINAFSEQELEELITVPAGRLGYYYNQKAIKSLKLLSGGHPFYCQALCWESFDIARKNKTKNITYQIVQKAKKTVIDKDEVRDKFIDGYWNFLKESKDDLHCLKNIIDQKEIDKTYNPRVQKLLDRQLIKKIDGEKYTIISELFKIWLYQLLRISIKEEDASEE
jgi:tetratricopeptide (TPR) repeat protein/GTPase SAR1 family protein